MNKLLNIFTWHGRVSKAGFAKTRLVLTVLIFTIVITGTDWLKIMMGTTEKIDFKAGIPVHIMVLNVILVYIGICSAVKRCHDLDESWRFIFKSGSRKVMHTQDGTLGANKYGSL